MAFANRAFGNATSISRKVGVTPEGASSPQRSVDMFRGKRRIKGSSVHGRSYQRATRSSQQGQMAELGSYMTL